MFLPFGGHESNLAGKVGTLFLHPFSIGLTVNHMARIDQSWEEEKPLTFAKIGKGMEVSNHNKSFGDQIQMGAYWTHPCIPWIINDMINLRDDGLNGFDNQSFGNTLPGSILVTNNTHQALWAILGLVGRESEGSWMRTSIMTVPLSWK